jgi:hypothetical protein
MEKWHQCGARRRHCIAIDGYPLRLTDRILQLPNEGEQQDTTNEVHLEKWLLNANKCISNAKHGRLLLSSLLIFGLFELF